ncbi:MAG TPA: heparinase II/III family protein [Bacteroidales bacterium]|nr:heparinase II/III family protein [Bacteroidales bacterium]HQM69103.1 heparinase II/III family protein [Bacteroidales bacterium]
MKNSKLLIATLLLSIFSFSVLNAELKPRERNILANEAKAINLASAMITDNSWNKLPGYKSRSFWDGLPAGTRQEYIGRAEKYLTYDWPVVKATDYLEFIRSGDRRQQVYSACSNALISLVMGELVEGKSRFLDQIINGVWYYSEQTWWGWSAHLGPQKAGSGLPDVNDPIVDLGVGEVTSNLSWTYYLFKEEFDKVHPLISKRLLQAITTKALTPYFEREDFGYMGFRGGRPNNWNPWVNYNMLTSYLLLETDPVKKVAEVTKILNSLDKFINGYSDDGGCDEGPSYWGAAGALMYENLEIMKNITNGKFDVFDEPLIRNMGQYFYKVNIHAPYFINFADADATTGGNASIVYRYGKAINDPIMWKFGAYIAQKGYKGEGALSGKIGDQIKNLGIIPEILKAEGEEALVADFWFPDTEVAGARDKAGSFTGFFFGAKGGFNAESHNHNDIGSCLMYFDGKPCLIDLGREEYVAKTFSSRRYEIWTMQSGYHNLPAINGADQRQGADFKARNSTFAANAKSATFSTDIAGAYTADAKVKSWIRSYTLNRGKSFVIRDNYILSEVVPGKTTSSNLITYCKVTQVKPGLLKFQGDGFTLNMSYNPKVVAPKIEFIEITDRSLKRYWPDGVTRVKLEFLNPGLKGSDTVTFTKSV